MQWRIWISLTSLKASVFYFGKNFTSVAFSGLGEAQNISLATKKCCLRQIKKECNIYTDHWKNSKISQSCFSLQWQAWANYEGAIRAPKNWNYILNESFKDFYLSIPDTSVARHGWALDTCDGNSFLLDEYYSGVWWNTKLARTIYFW